MLKHLKVRDFALSAENSLDFTEGMICITGETGAGKSLTVDALSLICGQRADAGVVRSGAARAEVEAVFSVDESLRRLLEERGIEPEDDGLIIRRQVSADGGSRAYVNGHAANLSLLREIALRLVAVHGQHASIRLLDERNQLTLLDAFAGSREPARRVSAAFEAYTAGRGELAELAEEQREGAARYRELRRDLEQLRALELAEGGYERLSSRYDELQHSTLLSDALSLAREALSNDERNVIDILGQRLSDLRRAASVDEKRLAPIISSLTGALQKLDETRVLLENTDTAVDPAELASLGERLSRCHELARQFAVAPGRLYTVTGRLESRLERFLSLKDKIAAQTAVVKDLRRDYEKLAGELSALRSRGAARLGELVSGMIHDLAMPDGRFRVECARDEEGRPRREGRDRVRFLFSANPGEELRTLDAVASGGELSRLALAIEVLTAGGQSVPTLIFDEVDTGISGRTASAVGGLLEKLGRGVQVIVVTHLPQVAACAATHFLVSKDTGACGVSSRVERLDEQGRVEELARMMGGRIVTEATLESARALLKRS